MNEESIDEENIIKKLNEWLLFEEKFPVAKVKATPVVKGIIFPLSFNEEMVIAAIKNQVWPEIRSLIGMAGVTFDVFGVDDQLLKPSAGFKYHYIEYRISDILYN